MYGCQSRGVYPAESSNREAIHQTEKEPVGRVSMQISASGYERIGGSAGLHPSCIYSCIQRRTSVLLWQHDSRTAPQPSHSTQPVMRVLWVQGHALVADLPATVGSHSRRSPAPCHVRVTSLQRSSTVRATIVFSLCPCSTPVPATKWNKTEHNGTYFSARPRFAASPATFPEVQSTRRCG